MKVQFRLNGKAVQKDIKGDILLIDLLRELGCYSVKRGCETSNCGLCTVWMDKKPILSCSVLAMERELECPTEEEIKEYLAGNLCRCSGYMSQLRAVQKYLNVKAQERKQESKGGNA